MLSFQDFEQLCVLLLDASSVANRVNKDLHSIGNVKLSFLAPTFFHVRAPSDYMLLQ